MKYGFNANASTDTIARVFGKFSELLYAIITKNPDEVKDEVKIAFEEVTSNAPEFEIGRFWEYFMCSACIAAAKKTPEIWITLDDELIEKLELMMELFLYTEATATNVPNDYRTGFKWQGHWGKHWNPNHRFANFGTMFFVIEYFGGLDAVNAKLAVFDFDSLMDRVQDAGFTKCYKLWTAPAKELEEGFYTRTVKDLLENGGEAYIKDIYGNIYMAGEGVSITTPYQLTSEEIMTQLLDYCYSGGPCVSFIDVDTDGIKEAHIFDETITPVEGRLGMFRELNAGDINNIRSSLSFSCIDYVLATAMIRFSEKFNCYNFDAHSELMERVSVGNEDLIYKVHHGYVGIANGHKEIARPSNNITGAPTMHLWAN